MSKNVLFVVGSLREGSFNHQAAKEVEALLAGKANVTYLDYKEVPVFNQDLETPVLPAVAKVREEIQKADAIWIFSPIYNFSIPGPVKNLLDWASRALDLSDTTGASALQDKLVTVSAVANGGHEPLFAAYNALLPFVRTQVVGDFTGTKVNPEAWATGELVLDEEAKASFAKQAEQLLAAIK
ncbi:MAG: NADPH-dependent FMN reductase [Gemella sp.]|nr:NADPH-dependent FMN reductase [Gemella sp.]